MLGDSDKDLLSQELQRLRMQQLAQNRAEHPVPGEVPESFADEEASTQMPPSLIPPWPTPVSDPASLSGDASAPDAPQKVPLPYINQAGPRISRPAQRGQQMASLPVVSRGRRITQPFSMPPTPDNADSLAASPAAGSFSPPGWHGFRRHSAWLVPALLVLLFFLLVLAVNAHLAGPMLFIFAAIGVLQAAVLLYAPNDAFWVVGVVGGFVIMMAVSFFDFFSPFFAVILSILLVVLGVLALRERYYPVKEGTVAVMGLFEKYNRTLQPGFNLQVPGEKVLGVVDTHRLRHEGRITSLILSSGEQISLDVAMSYQVITGQEYLAVRNTKDWRVPIQQQLVVVVQDEISRLSAGDFRRQYAGHLSQGASSNLSADTGDEEHKPSPLDHINELLTDALREQVADRGVAIHGVRLHLVEGPHFPGKGSRSVSSAAASRPPSFPPFTGQGTGTTIEHSAQAADPAGQSLPKAPVEGDLTQPLAGAIPPPPGTPIALPPRAGTVPSTGAPPTPPPALPAQALAETYDAVLRRRITDVATIRRIVAQFEAVANDPALSEQMPFDAAAGARNLQYHLYQLETQGAALLSPQSSADETTAAFPSSAAPPPPEKP